MSLGSEEGPQVLGAGMPEVVVGGSHSEVRRTVAGLAVGRRLVGTTEQTTGLQLGLTEH